MFHIQDPFFPIKSCLFPSAFQPPLVEQPGKALGFVTARLEMGSVPLECAEPGSHHREFSISISSCGELGKGDATIQVPVGHRRFFSGRRVGILSPLCS